MKARRFRTSLNRLALAGAVLLLPVTLLAQVTPPTITSYQAQSIPQKNPTTNTQPPPFALNFVGTGFLSTTTANFTWTGGSGAGTVHFISATSVLVTLPTTIPATVTTITPSLCNGTYCATGTPIPLTALSASSATLTGAPNPANVLQSVTLSSTFAPVQPVNGLVVTGAPSGTVTFTSGSTAIGTGKLVLDPVNSSFIANNTATLSQQPYSKILTADFNGDGIPDVLFTNSSNLHVLLGTTPYGTLQPEILSAMPPSCLFLNSLVTGDLNKDGLADIVLSCSNDSGVVFLYALLGNGDGTFATPVALSNAYGTSIALADMNLDGKLDLVVQGPLTPPSCSTSSTCTYGFAIFTGNGDGTFTASNQFITTVTSYTGLLLADIDHDGYPDIVVLNSSGMGINSIDIFLSHSGTSFGVVSGTTSAPSTSVALQAYPAFYSSLFSADFNGDGLPDLGIVLSGGTVGSGVSTMLNTSTPGSASFGTINTLSTAPSYPSSVAAADLNGDGFPDLVIDAGVNGLFYENDGKGNFANTYTNLTLPAGTVIGLTPVDLNDDGDADLLVLNSNYTSGTYTLTSYITSGSADASLTFAPAQAGTPTLTAAWPGNIDFTGSSANFTLTVNGSTTLVTIGSNLTTTQYGQPVTLSASVTSTQPGTPTGTIGFVEGDTILATVNLSATATASYTTSALKVGTHFINAIYSGDSTFSAAGSGSITISVNQAQPVVSWTPAPASITYGTGLVAGQLNATAATPYVTPVPGTFNYTPASGTVLGAGSQTLNVSFTPTDTVDFATATGSANITVGKATPTVTWNAPAAIVVGTPLSATQLNATVTGPLGTVAGAFVYTPAAGTLLAAGANQSLSVLFTPTDTTDYNTANGSTTITVVPVVITSLSPSSVTVGAAATSVTVTGTGFLPNSVININGTPVITTYISATSLSTTIPAASLLTAQTLSLTVTDPTQAQTSPAATFTVIPLTPTVTFTGPSTTPPGEQPALNFTIISDYPLAITGTVTLTFTGTGGVDDPSIQFSSGGRTLTFTIPANSTTTPAIQLQSGTDAGTITVTLVLTAGGQIITPPSIVPINITVPATVPSVTSMTLARSGNTITASIIGYSDTRELTQATFHFTGATGDTINTPDITIPATTLFATWFSNATSQPYGSSFLYTQEFNLSGDPSTIASVTVTLTNSVGASTSYTAQ